MAGKIYVLGLILSSSPFEGSEGTVSLCIVSREVREDKGEVGNTILNTEFKTVVPLFFSECNKHTGVK